MLVVREAARGAASSIGHGARRFCSAMLGSICSNQEVSLSALIVPPPMKSLPFATHQEAGTPWQIAWRNHGANESERCLASLSRRSFLTLWSYPNVYTDESRRNGAGDGKELCDLLVVFGKHVLLFPDKHCESQSTLTPRSRGIDGIDVLSRNQRSN